MSRSKNPSFIYSQGAFLHKTSVYPFIKGVHENTRFCNSISLPQSTCSRNFHDESICSYMRDWEVQDREATIWVRDQ